MQHFKVRKHIIKRSKLTSIRNFLEVNKVFFETVAATFLTIMSIFLISNSNKLTEHQNNLITMQSQPIFQIQSDSGDVSIVNSGSIGNNWHVEVASFLNLEASFNNNCIKTVEIPIQFEIAEIPNFKDDPKIVVKYDSFYPYELRNGFIKSLKKFIKANDSTFIELHYETRMYFKISYLDIFGELRIVYREYDFFRSHPVVEKIIGEKIFNVYKNEQLYNIAEIHNNKYFITILNNLKKST